MKTVLSFLVAFMTSMGFQALAQNSGIIYDDSLENGWQNDSSATVNLANTSPVHSGSDSIAVTAGPFQALYFHAAAPFDSTPYTSLTFWINGGATGGQTLDVVGLIGSSDVAQPGVPIGPLAPGVWQKITLSLSSLGVADQPNADGFWLQENAGLTQPTFYVDDVSLVSVPEPGVASLLLLGAAAILFRRRGRICSTIRST